MTTDLVTEQPEFAMGHALASYLSLTSTDAPDLPGARASVAELAALRLGAHETAHRAVIERWLGGDWHGAAAVSTTCSSSGPTDLLALLVGHQLDFFRGDAPNLRDRVARSFGRIDPASPHFGFVQGMFAFGLEESGDYLAAAHGLAAVTANPDDVWAAHAVVHVYEMQGRVDEGIGFLRPAEADWAAETSSRCTTGGTSRSTCLEAGRVDDALALYDAQIHNVGVGWRAARDARRQRAAVAAALDGEDTGGRFAHWPTPGRLVRRRALVRVQRRSRRDRFRRRRTHRRREPVIERLDRYVSEAEAPGHQRGHDVRDRFAGEPRRGRNRPR